MGNYFNKFWEDGGYGEKHRDLTDLLNFGETK
jgi:hypothetical protein